MKRKSEDKKAKVVWTPAEDDTLMKAVLEDQQDRDAEGNEEEDEDWDEIAKSVEGKTAVQCFKRYMKLNEKKAGDAESAPSVKEDDSPAAKKAKTTKEKGESAPGKVWSSEEVELLKKLVEQYKESKFL